MPSRKCISTAVTLFLGCLCWAITLPAQSNADKKVKITTDRKEGYYDVYIENGNPYDITITLNISGKNFRASKRTPVKEVIRPDSKNQILKVFPVDEEKSFSFHTNYSWFMGDVNARHNDAYVYALPYKRGESYRLGQGFKGEFSHSDRSTYALDFMMPVGTPVLAAREGVVIQTHSESDTGGPSEKYAKDSNYIVIRHSDATLGEYAHLRKDGVLVEPGDRVRKGEHIGYSGNTGYSSGPHLHFMVTKVSEDGSSQSLPIKFRAKEGIVTNPVEGKIYQAM